MVMNLLSSYMLKRCLLYIFSLWGVFAILFLVINIMTSSNVGHGDFNFISAIYYSSLSIPSIIYLISPISVLIGVEIALISLVNYSEYVIFRVNGISLFKIMQLLFIVGSIFAGLTFILGEYIAPSSNNLAEIYKTHKTKSKAKYIYNLSSGIWVHDGESSFVNIRGLDLDNNMLSNVAIYNYTPDMQLLNYKLAKSATYDQNKHSWLLQDVEFRDYINSDTNIIHHHYTSQYWLTTLTPQYFKIFVKSPENMSIRDLTNYLKLPDVNSVAQQEYKVLFWRKVFYPFYCIIMALLALIFIPNNRRNINLGNKLILGLITGVSFYFLIQLISRIAVLFQLNALLFQLIPIIILFAICGLVLKFKP